MKSRLILPRLLFALVILVFSGCGAEFFGEMDDETWVVQADAIKVGFGARAEGPVLAYEESFNRVGFQWDAHCEKLSLAVRVSSGQGRMGDWLPVEVTFAEPPIYNGRVDLAGEATSFQVALLSGNPGDLSFLAAEPIVFDHEAALQLSLTEEDEPGLAGDVRQADDGSSADGISTLVQAMVAGGHVNPRSSWGARATRCSTQHTPVRTTIHHTAGPNNDSSSPEQRMRSTQNYHMDNRGWCDIGYHYLVSQDGRLWEGRAVGLQGAHVLNHNSRNTGISFMGTYSGDVSATQTQLNNVAQLLTWLAGQYGQGMITNLVGHRDLGSTECPGDNLYTQLGALKALADGGTIEPPVPMGSYRGVVFEDPDLEARIPGARVWVEGTDQEKVVGDDGAFVFQLSPGSYRVHAEKEGYQSAYTERQVTDGGTAWGSIGLNVDVVEPPEQPEPVDPLTISILSPRDGDRVEQSQIEVSGIVSPAEEVDRVMAMETQVPITGMGEFSFDVRLVEGENRLSVTAESFDGQRATAAVTVYMEEGAQGPDDGGDNWPDPGFGPTVDISRPVAGTTFTYGRIFVEGLVDPPSQITIFVDGVEHHRLDSDRFNVQVDLAAGENVIRVRATDGDGLSGEASRLVYLEDSDVAPGSDKSSSEGGCAMAGQRTIPGLSGLFLLLALVVVRRRSMR